MFQHLYFKLQSGKTIGLSLLKKTDKVQQIKAILEEKEGIPPAHIKLVYGGVEMGDERSLKQCGVKDYSLVNFHIKAPGTYCSETCSPV